MPKLIVFLVSLIASLFSTLTVLFSISFFHRYSLEYNDMGSFFDEVSGVVYHDSSVVVYGLLSIFCLIVSFITWYWVSRRGWSSHD